MTERFPDQYIFEPIEDIVYGVLYVRKKFVELEVLEEAFELMGRVTADVDNIPFRDRFLEDANA